MDNLLTYGTIGAFVVVLAAWIGNLVIAYRHGKPSAILGRCVYIFGILAALLNIVRVIRIYDNSQGVMLLANAIVLVCVIVAFYRSERAPATHNEPNEESDAQDETP